MTQDELEIYVGKFFDACHQLVASKGRDYSPDGIAFVELAEQAGDLNVPTHRVLWVFMRKHISAIRTFVRTGQLQSEPIEKRLQDLANFCALFAAVLDCEADAARQAKEKVALEDDEEGDVTPTGNVRARGRAAKKAP